MPQHDNTRVALHSGRCGCTKCKVVTRSSPHLYTYNTAIIKNFWGIKKGFPASGRVSSGFQNFWHNPRSAHSLCSVVVVYKKRCKKRDKEYSGRPRIVANETSCKSKWEDLKFSILVYKPSFTLYNVSVDKLPIYFFQWIVISSSNPRVWYPRISDNCTVLLIP